MAILYQCNGLERANPRWHTNQSLSITMMTDFPIINTPAVLHMKSTPYGFYKSTDMKAVASTFTFIYTYICTNKALNQCTRQIHTLDPKINVYFQQNISGTALY